MYSLASEHTSSFKDLSPEEIDLIDVYCLTALNKSKGIHSAKKCGVQTLCDSDLVPQVRCYDC